MMRRISPLRHAATAIVMTHIALMPQAFAADYSFANETQIEINTENNGQITKWKVNGKTMVPPSDVSPLNIEIFRNGKTVRADFHPSAHREVTEANRVGVCISGVLSNGAETFAKADISYYPDKDGRSIEVHVRSEATQAFTMRDFSWRLPLDLAKRKRVYFRGENGLDWESRTFYQFTVNSPSLVLSEPDHNEWRFFVLDQFSPDAFRLWKSESASTSPLLMQGGRHAPGIMQVYDQKHGLSVASPQLPESAPRRLWVDSSDGGALGVSFWFPSLPALAVGASAEQTAPFGKTRTFTLFADDSEAGINLRRKALLADEPAVELPTKESVLQEPVWLRETPGTSPGYVTGGYPFAQGVLIDAASASVQFGGKAMPSQNRAIAKWPDGSVKWLLITAPLSKEASGEAPAPYVSLRTGKRIAMEVLAKGPKPPVSSETVSVVSKGDDVTIDTGRTRVSLGKGTNWLRSLQFDNYELLESGPADRLAYCDYWLTDHPVMPGEREPLGGTWDGAALEVSSVVVEESGPLRAIVRLEGMVPNKEPTRLILRIEALAGETRLKITHSAEFLFKDPRRTFLAGMGLALPLRNDSPALVTFPGSMALSGTSAAALVQETPEWSAIRKKSGESWETLANGRESQGWISVAGKAATIVAAVRNFWQTAPKALTFDPKNGLLDVQLWPALTVPMDVRRYSNFPHRAQGESVPADQSWVESFYYKNDPFVGISRTHEILLDFSKPDASSDPVALAANFQSPPLVYAGWNNYLAAGVVLPEPAEGEWPAARAQLSDFAAFWLFHQQFHRWYGFWDFGNLRHNFQSGYGWILPPEELKAALETAKTKPTERVDRKKRVLDYTPPNDWAFDNGRWGWTNTEGLPGRFLQHEYLRTGNRAIFFAAEALGNHSRDVVTRQAGQWFGRGTRHGVQHWSCGNHEERQTVVTEYKTHYFLTGDDRSRDVVARLYRDYWTKTDISVDAAHSARLNALLFHWEMTGDAGEAEQMQKYVSQFVGPQGIYGEPQVRFPGATSDSPPEKPFADGMFFHYFGATHALLEYYQSTKNPALREAIIQNARAVIENPDMKQRYLTARNIIAESQWGMLAFAAAHADNPLPFRDFLTECLRAKAWELTYQTVADSPRHWTGPTAFVGGGIPGCFFWANFSPYILSTLGKQDIIWNEEIARRVAERNRAGMPSRRGTSSWQGEYDMTSDLADYFNPHGKTPQAGQNPSTGEDP